MRKKIAQVVLLFLFGVLFAAPGQAQLSQRIVKAKIPFSFIAGRQEFPAGEYSFVSTPEFLVIRDQQGRDVAALVAGSAERNSVTVEPKVKFYVDHGRHILVQLWQGDSRLGAELYFPKHKLLETKHQTVEAASGGQP